MKKALSHPTRVRGLKSVSEFIVTLLNLNYTQAFILLGVQEEERAQFIAEMGIESMSTRELQKGVNDRSHAVKEGNPLFFIVRI